MAENSQVHAAPSLAWQRAFFAQGFDQVENPGSAYAVHRADGPLYDEFNSVQAGVAAELRQLNPHANVQHLADRIDDIQPEADMVWPTQDITMVRAYTRLRERRRVALGKLAADTVIPALRVQTLPNKLLADPPFAWQGQSIGAADTRLNPANTCTNACMRMIFGGIAGWVPDEKIIAQEIYSRYNSTSVPDATYLTFLQTPQFFEHYGKRVSRLDFTGADFAWLGKLIGKFARPGVQAFCMINLGSEITKDLWHSNILLSADEESVVCHDPLRLAPSPGRRLPHATFAVRWAYALNRGSLVIAR